MSVTLLEPGLRQLLDSETGAVGRDLARRAFRVVEIAERNTANQILQIRTGDLHGSIVARIERDERGLHAKIGSPARHRGFGYPAHLEREGFPWLSNALREGYRG